MHSDRSGTGLRAILLLCFLALTAVPGQAARRAQPAEPLPLVTPPVSTDRILIVAPHVDDEAIAAAGYVSAARALGAEVYVAYLTAGDCNLTSARMMGRTLRPGPGVFLRVGERRVRAAGGGGGAVGVPPP